MTSRHTASADGGDSKRSHLRQHLKKKMGLQLLTLQVKVQLRWLKNDHL
jgi:hypothetical protein